MNDTIGVWQGPKCAAITELNKSASFKGPSNTKVT